MSQLFSSNTITKCALMVKNGLGQAETYPTPRNSLEIQRSCASNPQRHAENIQKPQRHAEIEKPWPYSDCVCRKGSSKNTLSTTHLAPRFAREYTRHGFRTYFSYSSCPG
eukprot:g78330.t1